MLVYKWSLGHPETPRPFFLHGTTTICWVFPDHLMARLRGIYIPGGQSDRSGRRRTLSIGSGTSDRSLPRRTRLRTSLPA